MQTDYCHQNLSRGIRLYEILFVFVLASESATSALCEEAVGSLVVTQRIPLLSALTPYFFTNTPPTDYTEERLAKVLHEKLTPEELALVVNPLTTTPEMNRWAHELTGRATNDLQKAGALYEALVGRVIPKPAPFPKPPAAKEVFAAWNTPAVSFACQDLSFFYVALARAVGLKAYDAFVEEDYRGTKLSHHCAAVFVADKAFLVDLAASTFGAEHRKFTVLDDLQTVAVYLCGMQGLRQCEIGSKLAPRLPFVVGSLFETLTIQGRWKEAEEQLAIMVQLDPVGPETYAARGLIALQANNGEQAIHLLRKAIALAPETTLHYEWLGFACLRQARWSDAREAFQNALRYAPYEQIATGCEAAIAIVDGKERMSKRDAEGALVDYNKAVELKPDWVYGYAGRGAAALALNDLNKAKADLDKAIQMDSKLPDVWFNRGLLKMRESDLDGARHDFDKAAALSPEALAMTAPQFARLGCLRYDRHQFTEALVDFRRAAEAGDQNDYVTFFIWLIRSRLGEQEAATKDLKQYLAEWEKAKADDWAVKIGSFLVGKLTEAQLFKGAKIASTKTADGQCCEAYFYAGTKRLIDGDKRTAVTYFEKCIATEVKDFAEYKSAAAELRWLKAGK
jgi:tetratricopeptide (TPR) repeat protein